MEENLEKVKDAIIGPMEDMDILVDSVTYEQEGSIRFLRIVLDKEDGIDLDTIVEATNVINPIIDTFDFIDESYILDIISKERGVN